MAATSSTVSSTPTPAVRWPLTGRHGELEVFESLLAAGQRDAFVLQGARGVGKTRLADACLAAAARLGHATGRAAASEAASAVPLGALAHLLPSDVGAGDALRLFSAARDALRSRTTPGGRRRFVLLIDDLDLLDRTSAALLGQLMDARVVVVLATVRDGNQRSTSALVAERGDRTHRIVLAAFDPAGTELLLHLSLGGPVERRALDGLWERSQGNPLFLRELVTGAVDSGALGWDGFAWRLTGELATTPRLVDLVAARVESLAPAARDALEWLAACGSVDAERLDPDALDALEHAELVTVAAAGRRIDVQLAHPVHGEVVRSTIPRMRLRRMLLARTAQVTEGGARRAGDALHVAGWQLEATGTADPGLLLRAAELARWAHDYEQVVRLATAATAVDAGTASDRGGANDAARGSGTGEASDAASGSGTAAASDAATASEAGTRARLLLGEALSRLGRSEQADEVLQEAGRRATDEGTAVLVALQRVHGAFWGRADGDAALAINAAARERVRAPASRAVLDLDRGGVLVFAGRPAAGLEILNALDDVPDPRVRVMAATARAAGLAVQGRTADALSVSERAYAEHVALSEQALLSHPEAQLAVQVLARCDAGDMATALEVGRRGHAAAVRDRAPLPQIWLALNLSRACLVGGRPATAARWAAEALALTRAHGFRGPAGLTLACLAHALAMLGDLAAAEQLLEEQRAEPVLGFLAAETQLAAAWTCAGKGDLATARDLLLAGADAAEEAGFVVSATWLLCDAARLGAPGAVADRLSALAAGCDGTLVPARAAYVRALVDRDPARLGEAAEALEAAGADLVAAEAFSACADAWVRAGQARRAAAARVRAATAAGRCEGAKTYGLVLTDEVQPLTAREREIAMLASAGRTSKEIAADLVLSVRTVDNHLMRVYSKLGVTGRGDLANALRSA